MRHFVPVILGVAALLTAQTAAIRDSDLVSPSELAAHLAEKPLILHVGFPVLYRAAHIPGSGFAGPGSKAEGIASLRKAVEGQPRNREIVLYCGCCPWSHCPNVKPADDTLRTLGFTNVKVLYIADNFGTNWVDKGYPVAKGE